MTQRRDEAADRGAWVQWLTALETDANAPAPGERYFSPAVFFVAAGSESAGPVVPRDTYRPGNKPSPFTEQWQRGQIKMKLV
jgi:hypothetical protein